MSFDLLPKIYPFTTKLTNAPDWSTAIISLNQVTPYPPPISPPSSMSDIEYDIAKIQTTIQNEAFMYIIFEVSHSNTNLDEKFKQLESQLAFIIVRFHLRKFPSTQIPKSKDEFNLFISQEVLKLVAFSGVSIVSDASKKLMDSASKCLNSPNNRLPAITSLYENGRLLYVCGSTYPSRLSCLQLRLDAIEENIATKEDISDLTRQLFGRLKL